MLSVHISPLLTNKRQLGKVKKICTDYENNINICILILGWI